MDKRELKIDYFVSGIQCPHAMRNCLKKLWLLPAKLIASIPILLSERRFAGKWNDRFRQ